ncbi:hypothetical protein ACFLQZ_00375 [Acidobacteriota bacterium]
MTIIKEKKAYLIILLVIVLLFIIGLNIAWLNPRPNFKPELRISDKVPVLWQYNYDSKFEFASAAQFPEYYKAVPIRINRPIYSLCVFLLSKPVEWILSPFLTPERARLGSTVIGFIIFKFIIFLIGSLIMYRLLSEFIGPNASLFAVCLMLFHTNTIMAMATYHSSEFQIFSAIFIAAMFLNISKDYSLKKNIIFSLIVGILMLTKQNYAAYLAVILCSLWYKKWREVSLSIVIHLIPLGIWLLCLKLMGLSYYNHEAVVYKQGVWLFQEFIHYSIPHMLKMAFHFMKETVVCLVKFYSFWLFVSLIAIPLALKRIKHSYLFFGAALFFTTYLQIFAAHRIRPYIISELSIFVYGLVSLGLFQLLKTLKPRQIKIILTVIIIGWIVWSLLQIANFPWLSPFQQIGT